MCVDAFFLSRLCFRHYASEISTCTIRGREFVKEHFSLQIYKQNMRFRNDGRRTPD